ncbi:MAG TPA: ornithine cyclodeaminase family protein [Gaiellaceae bacterium]|nr:ornithine cyclodeaminase family protein [Gaiellaceae bacterium]
MIPLFTARHVEEAVSPERAVEAVREAFLAYARGEWSMPPKVYVPAYPAGDFRAMPALGAGHASLKWVTSFPGNPAKGLPTVTGVVLLSSAEDGRLVAALHAGAVTALRTGAAAVLACETLGRPGSAAVIGAGVNGRAAARTFVARGQEVALWDVDSERARTAADELGAHVAGSREDALAADRLVTMTPGHDVLLSEGSLRSGQHVSLMGADGPGKAEIAVAELVRTHVLCDDREQGATEGTPGRVRLFVDDWEQASHGGETAAGVKAGLITRDDVTELGKVLAGDAPGRQDDSDVTLFDSTGLAIQDLAIALAAMESAADLELPTIDL